MNTTLSPSTTTRPHTTTPNTGPRPDLYATIHKALRALMFDTVQRVGRMDLDDAGDTCRTLDQAEALLAQLQSHVRHENDFVHAAIEARRPGGAQAVAAAHGEHLDSIAALNDEIVNLRRAPAPERTLLADRLYRHLGLFVAENLEHMQVEETAHNALLWSLYSDDELLALHDRIVAHVEPALMMESLGWMARALRPQELAGLLGQLQRQAPPEAVRAVLEHVRTRLDDTRWAKLARALGLPSVPGVVAR